MIYTNEQNYIDIANAIRNLGGVGTFKPDEMAEAISGLGYDWDALAHRDFNGEANLTVNPRIYGLAGSNITKLTGSITTISNYLCQSCVALEEVNLPNCTTIGTYSFQNDTALTTVSIPSATGTIGTYAFTGCTALQNVSMPNVTAVGAYAFQNCKSFTEINFPALKTLANYGFAGCSNAVSVNLPEAIGTTSITYFLSSNPKLTSIKMPKLAATGQHFFRYNTGLTQVAFPVLKNINSYALAGCTNLLAVDFLGQTGGGAVAANAFNGSTKLNTLIIRGNLLAPLANVSAFTNTPFASGKTGGTLYVPQAQIDTYKAATNWVTMFGDSRATGYVNNQILPIEGSIYENKYADGTTIS